VFVIGNVLHGLLWLFILFLWIRFVFDWVQIFARSWSPGGVLLVALELVYSVTDPPIKALRRFIPPIRIGNFALDLSFILVLVAAYVLLQVVSGVFLT
jgi:YggT family protein